MMAQCFGTQNTCIRREELKSFVGAKSWLGSWHSTCYRPSYLLG